MIHKMNVDASMNINEKYLDLHIHSTVSDGTWNAEEIAVEIRNKGVGLYSITDHDSINGVVNGETFAKQSSLNYLRGVEISSTLNGDWEHVLAYGIDLKNGELLRLLRENRDKLKQKYIDSIQHLEYTGYSVRLDEFLDYKNDRSRGGFEVLNYLIDKGICRDIKEYLSMFKDMPQVSNFPEYRNTSNVVQTIKKAGGVPVIAHPFYTISKSTDVDERLSQFLELGIEGVECFHPSHDRRISTACMKFCKKNNLAMTVGSDCHGSFAPGRIIGMHGIRIGDISLGKLSGCIL